MGARFQHLLDRSNCFDIWLSNIEVQLTDMLERLI